MNNDVYEENLRVLNRIKEYCANRLYSGKDCHNLTTREECPFYIWCQGSCIAPCSFPDEAFKKMAEVLE